MKRKSITLMSLLILAAPLTILFAMSMAPAVSERLPTAALAECNNEFALNIYGELSKADGNLFFSPYSISSALAMTYGGARGNTANEMNDAMRFQIEQAKLPMAFKALNNEIWGDANKDGQKLSIANGLCLTDGDLSGEFKALLKDNYDAELFSGGLDKINGWVKQKTEGKIEKILEALDPNSVCVLLNAIYFKGLWEDQFKPGDTRDAPFYLSPDKQVTAPLMNRKGDLQILKKQDFQAASIPYKGKALSMVMLLPDAVDGLSRLEKQMTGDNLKQWMSELNRQPAVEARLSIPKFKMETGYDLSEPCKSLGIREAFMSGRADFSGMGFPKGKLWISQIKHKAFVEVNEEGTEAAAATAVVMQTTAVRKYPIFHADHPFIFIIRDNRTESILFMGRLADPTKK